MLLMLAPAAPHVTEELWSRARGGAGRAVASIHAQRWPTVDASAIVDETREIPVQINGKVRDRVVVPVGITRPSSSRSSSRAIASASCSRVGRRSG